MFDRRTKHMLTPSNAPYVIIGLLAVACFLGLTICNECVGEPDNEFKQDYPP